MDIMPSFLAFRKIDEKITVDPKTKQRMKSVQLLFYAGKLFQQFCIDIWVQVGIVTTTCLTKKI